MLKAVLFDLDGTLLDTGEGIMASVAHAVEVMGYPPLTHEQLRTFVGPPLAYSYKRYLGCSDEEAAEGILIFRAYYLQGAILRAVPYPGIPELLAGLGERGIRCAVATSKPQSSAELLLNHFELTPLFGTICGADLKEHLTKADIIRRCLSNLDLAPCECVMVGDTEYDALGAQEAGVPFVAASYGYGYAPGEMPDAPHVGVAATAEEIAALLGVG